jgi:hypothetical protein
MSAINVNDLGGRHVGGWEPTDTPYVLGVSPGRRLTQAAERVVEGLPDDMPPWQRVGMMAISVDALVELKAALKEAINANHR